MTQRHTGFTAASRHISEEEEIQLCSVGVDIGSSTSHLVFSRLTLERQGTRYVITNRVILHESDILLTPYQQDVLTIDSDALGKFIHDQYLAAGLRREEVDTGALILTGVAVRRRNARAIGELFAEEAGKFVAVSAGDGLEATMAAHGSGAVAESARTQEAVMNIDIGGGTTKLALCKGGAVLEVTALDVGARLVALGEDGTVERIEEAGAAHAQAAGVDLRLGKKLTEEEMQAMASIMADRLMELIDHHEPSEATKGLLRLPPLSSPVPVDTVIFSGGVSEYIYGHEEGWFGDMGPVLAQEVKRRAAQAGVLIMTPTAGIRATVIGASQYTIQVSGSTIFIDPPDAVPVRNIPVITPQFDLEAETLDAEAIGGAVRTALTRLDLANMRTPIAVALRWRGSATFWRLDAFCKGVMQGLQGVIDRGHPLVLVNDGDIGGLIGLHAKEEMRVEIPVISIDGIDLQEFDFIDIGALIPSSGAVPVVIKSLIFPGVVREAD